MIDFGVLNDIVVGTFQTTGAVIIRRSGQPDQEVAAIFDSRHYEVREGETGTSDLLTSVTMRAAEAGPVRADDVVLVDGLEYRVWEPRADGEGMVTLALERA